MKKFIFTLLTVLNANLLFAQNNKGLSISLATGIFNSPYYVNAQKREFYSFDFNYHFNTCHILAANFTSGHHRFYDDVRSNNAVPLNIPGYEKNANAEAEYLTFSILYKYKLWSNKKVSVTAGAGAGIMTQTVLYPYTEGNIVDFRQSTWTELVFPVRLELDLKILKHFQAGLICGLFIHPDYPVLGYHAGPRLSYILK